MASTVPRLAATIGNIDAQRTEPVLVPVAADHGMQLDVEFFHHLVQRIQNAGLLVATAATELSATAAATVDEALVELDEALHHIQREVLAMRCAEKAD